MVKGPGLRKRLRMKAQEKVFEWIFGTGTIGPGDPRQRYVVNGPAWPTFRSLEFEPGTSPPVVFGRYSGMNYSATVVQDGEHHTDWVSQFGGYVVDGEYREAPGAVFNQGPVVVGNDVWIAYEALIMSGVTIGDGATVGARAVVRRSVEPFEIVGGDPIRHLGYRFDEPTREALLRIKWWDWSDEKVTAHVDQIHSADVAGFVAGHDPALGPPSCPRCAR